MMDKRVFLSVIIPAYNEEANIGHTLEEVLSYLNSKNFSSEVIVVDDGSSDRTTEVVSATEARAPSLRLLKNDINLGKGYAVRRGMLEASGEYRLFMDADNSTSIREFEKFLPAFEAGSEVVIGSRHLKGSNILVAQPLMRRVLGKAYRLFTNALLFVNVSDCNCGFKAFTRKAAEEIFSRQRINNWSLDSELVFLVKRLKFNLKEIPITWKHKHTSKVRPLKDSVKSLLSLLAIRKNALLGRY